jgi:hypothetical protein
MQAVVRLIPRSLGSAPSVWAAAQQFTVYQKNGDEFNFDVPARIEGPVRLQGKLKLGEAYEWSSSARTRFFGDLNAMRTSGNYGDYRPFSGRISLPFDKTDSTTRSLLSSQLALSLSDISETSRPTIPYPSGLATYRLYPGGATYNVPQLGSTVQDVALQADPATNPLGLFYCSGATAIRNNVTIKGTLIGANDLTIGGTGVSLQCIDLPNVDGASSPLRLPAAVAGDDFAITSAGAGTVTGNVIVNDKFDIERGAASQRLNRMRVH